jgi:ElaB/YqjD/DUF883 family membrane-anchored ribosome-binding protein
MFIKSTPLTHGVTDGATRAAETAMHSTQRVADQALDALSGTARDLRQDIAPLLERAGEQAGALAQRSADAMRERTQQLREQTLRASDNTLNYIRAEPVKSVLIAAAAGGALVALLGLLRRSV